MVSPHISLFSPHVPFFQRTDNCHPIKLEEQDELITNDDDKAVKIRVFCTTAAARP